MIFLRTSGVDDVPAGSNLFADVAAPVGMRDGDLVLVGVAVDTADTTVTAPEGWTRVFRTDPSRAVSLAVFWKIALNEPARWSFELSAAVDCQAAVAVYGGAEGWNPIEIATAAGTVSSATQNTPAGATALDNEELALFLAAGAVGTFTPAGDYDEIAAKSNGGSIAIHRLAKPIAGSIPAGTVMFSTPADGASVLVALRPSDSEVSVDDARQIIIDGFPRGVERVYDLEQGGDYFKLFQSIALAAKQTVFDLVELLRREIVPQFSRYLLPEWERVFGVTTTRAAQRGTVPDRQAQVISRWREASGLGSTRAAVTAILGPLLGYNPTTEVEVVTTDRDLLRIEHSYDLGSQTIASSGTASLTFETVDGGKVSDGGARVQLEYGAGSGSFAVLLVAPDLTFKSWTVDLDGQALDLLFGAEFAGAQMDGLWHLVVFNNTAGSLTLIPTAFVEGVQPDHLSVRQDTAAAMFDWGAYADPVHMGENGKPADMDAARAAIQRMAFAHTIGNLLQSIEALPDVDVGADSAIPDECLPA